MFVFFAKQLNFRDGILIICFHMVFLLLLFLLETRNLEVKVILGQSPKITLLLLTTPKPRGFYSVTLAFWGRKSIDKHYIRMCTFLVGKHTGNS